MAIVFDGLSNDEHRIIFSGNGASSQLRLAPSRVDIPYLQITEIDARNSIDADRNLGDMYNAGHELQIQRYR